ncbi:MAG TPA: hypothetical protein VNQ53_14600, partial [Nocardioides sp.]|nr:hypothetical protein [Nocardioides sp.]
MTAAAPAKAHQSPAGCNASRLHLDLVRDRTEVKNGDVINYWVDVDNIGTSACDTSNITILLQLPGPDGNPRPLGQAMTVVSNANYNAQAPIQRFGPFPYTVAANPGVIRLEALASISAGVLHDLPAHSAININKTIGSTIIPQVEVDKEANIK